MVATALPFFVEPTDPPSKRELLKAALKLFAREGVRETSIRAIAAEAGFTNPVLFKFFEGKDALAVHLFERCYLRVARDVVGAISGDTRFELRLGQLVHRLLLLLDENPEALLFVNEELRRFWPDVSPSIRRHSLIRVVRDFFAERHSASPLELTLQVAAFWGLMGQFARLHTFGELTGKAVDFAPQLQSLVLKMLQG